ncbi:hypothetical protein [Nocardioides nanhaiensis]|uniref:Uncharacterized protein n=1 Tax=Nocardioides nanhaiensis TaxID=1476871 RepID=A0ABP8W4H8_9ACTN
MTLLDPAAEWSTPRDGTAHGRPRTIEFEDGVITVTPLWSDVEGVTFDLNLPDAPLNVNTTARLIDLMSRLLMLSPVM